MKKILLVGNPNVGKSVLFSRLTGIHVIASNYPGTTVEFTKGVLKIGDEKYEVVDLPGTYALEPTTKAEEVAVRILEETKKEGQEFIIINVVDATNLERNLNLTLQLINKKLPLIIVLNFWDEIRHKGIQIEYKKLQEILGVPVIPTCARSGEGIKELTENIKNAKISNFYFHPQEKWTKIGEIVQQIQTISHKHHTFLDRISETTIRPATGLPFALLVLFLTFFLTRFLGENLINYVFDPLFNNLYQPFLEKILQKISCSKIVYDILLGTTPKPMESFGILTTGVYIPLVVVLPYIISFYLILSILEDIGYIPRVAVMLDNFLHRLGVHGYSSVPILLGLGCKVPGILATRILETTREKIIATVLLLTIAPCMPQTAMIISILSPYGLKFVFFVFFTIFINSLIISFLLNKILKGETPELFLEIPPYRMIYLPTLFKKLYLRIKTFFVDAVPLIFIGIVIINFFEVLGINKLLAETFGKIFLPILGLPKEVASVIILGFLRKDVSISLLIPFNLPAKQLVVTSIFMVLYLPCVSTFFVTLRELGIKNTIKIMFIMLICATLLSFIIKNVVFLTLDIIK